MKNISKITNICEGVINQMFEDDDFWEDRDKKIILDLKQCTGQLVRLIIEDDLSIDDDWDTIGDEAWDILAVEYDLMNKVVNVPKKYNRVVHISFDIAIGEEVGRGEIKSLCETLAENINSYYDIDGNRQNILCVNDNHKITDMSHIYGIEALKEINKTF